MVRTGGFTIELMPISDYAKKVHQNDSMHFHNSHLKGIDANQIAYYMHVKGQIRALILPIHDVILMNYGCYLLIQTQFHVVCFGKL